MVAFSRMTNSSVTEGRGSTRERSQQARSSSWIARWYWSIRKDRTKTQQAGRWPDVLSQAMTPDHIVFIVDDDSRIREALTELLLSFDMHAVAFGSAAEYMAYPKPDLPGCLVLDLQLPD